MKSKIYYRDFVTISILILTMASQIFEASSEVDAQIMLIGIKFYSMPHLFYLQQFQQFNGGGGGGESWTIKDL